MVTINLDPRTIVEILVAVAFIGGVTYISTKSDSTSKSSSKKGKGKKKKNNSNGIIGGLNVDDEDNEAVGAVVKAPVVAASKKKKRVDAPVRVTNLVKPEIVEDDDEEEEDSTPIPAVKVPIVSTKSKSKPSKLTPTPSTPSFASVTSTSTSSHPPSTSTSNSKDSPSNLKTFAESRYIPPVATAMDDMRDEEIDPKVSMSRVIRIVDPNAAARVPKKGALKYDEWGDLIENEEDGWETAKVKKPTKPTTLLSKPSAASAFAASNPAPRVVPGMASVEMTKKQRENSKKSGRAAADKEEAERERLDRLANHRRELDRARIMEAERERNKKQPSKIRSENVSTTKSGASKAKLQSGGMHASLDDSGKLIWE